jgi:hypothetical protein
MSATSGAIVPATHYDDDDDDDDDDQRVTVGGILTGR